MAGNSTAQRKKGERNYEKAPKTTEGPYHPSKKVYVSPSGHQVIENDVPGKWWKMELFPDGSFKGQLEDGTSIQSSGSETVVENSGSSVTIKHNQDTYVGGHKVESVGGGMTLAVAGAADVTVGKGATINVLGDAIINSQGNMQVSSGGNLSLNAGGSFNLHSKGGMDIGSASGIKIQGTSIAMQHAGDGAPGYKG